MEREEERERKRERERERGRGRERERERERRKSEGNRQRFILKSGLLLSGEGEGGRGRRTDETEAAILPPPVQYGRASANCPSLPLVPDGERKGRGERESIPSGRKEQRASEEGRKRNR